MLDRKYHMNNFELSVVTRFVSWYDKHHGFYSAYRLMKTNPELFNAELIKFEEILLEAVENL